MADYGKCVCGKRVSRTTGGRPRKHVCTADISTFADPSEFDRTPAQPVVPADVDETDPFVSPTMAPSDAGDADVGTPSEGNDKGPWVAAQWESTLDCGHWVGEGDEIRADGEGGWECREMCDDVDETEHVHRFEYFDDNNGHSGSYCECGAEEPVNWNGTGRPRPSASNVKMPEPEPQTERPRLLDTLREGVERAQEQARTVLNSPALESAGIGMKQMADAFSMPTPPGPVADQSDPFSTPTHVAPALGSATDQPETERDRYGRYLIKDPRTGDFKRNRRGTPEGFTRATTYGKTLLDQFGIHQWEMRSVLAGLALRPDLVARAKGLDVAADKDTLNAIAAEAKDAAGGNEAASDGTEFHTVTEWIDTGRMNPKDAPEKFRAEALVYAAKMEEAGLQTRTGFIERVTFTDRGGEDVAGTADRILLERSGTPVVGDVKSGKGVDLAQREIAIQLKVYAMGINQFGLYNKSTQQWEPWTGPPVSEEYGIVMHVPVVRPEGTEAYCDLYRIDLRGVPPYEVSSAMHAAAWVREWRKQKGFLSPYHAPAAVLDQPTRTWAEAFASVTTPEEANRLWEAAVDAGMDQPALDENVALARQALQLRG